MTDQEFIMSGWGFHDDMSRIQNEMSQFSLK